MKKKNKKKAGKKKSGKNRRGKKGRKSARSRKNDFETDEQRYMKNND